MGNTNIEGEKEWGWKNGDRRRETGDGRPKMGDRGVDGWWFRRLFPDHPFGDREV
ncbi:hypothetical protein KI659_16440 [Litoribacter alkaliphilus]|uniref:Uncharacterized protein n=1 Tax=Litoribacter ruber TaxID=702568 RepID=A0AAP2G6E4_9BACT|nr:hypothetical protein [Litoribacter alkaliphilus]MBS9525608.1 hypothetical protein [Litoribacter alkaliphilus]